MLLESVEIAVHFRSQLAGEGVAGVHSLVVDWPSPTSLCQRIFTHFQSARQLHRVPVSSTVCRVPERDCARRYG